MKIFKLLLVAVFVVMTSTGCISRMSEEETLYAKSFPTPPNNMAGLYVYRKSYFVGSGKGLNIYVDGRNVAEIASGDFYYDVLPIGQHYVTADPYIPIKAIMSGEECLPNNVTFNMKEKKNYFVQIDYYEGTIERVDEENAKIFIKDMDRVSNLASD